MTGPFDDPDFGDDDPPVDDEDRDVWLLLDSAAADADPLRKFLRP